MRFAISPRRCRLTLVLCLAAVCTFSREVVAQAGSSFARKDPAAVLARAKEVMRFERLGQSVIHYHAVAAEEENYQSDRSYPPFFAAMATEELWFDPQSRLERMSTQTTFPGGGPSPARVEITNAKGAFGLAEGHANPLPGTSLQWRYLDPWAVIADWASAGDARLATEEIYRDYPRTVLMRKTPAGDQHLFLDPKSGFPVKLDLEERHYLWGQRHIEYLYTNWVMAGGVMVPGSSFRIADEKVEISRTTGDVEIIPRSAAPALVSPEEPAQPVDSSPVFLLPIDPKTVQVGPRTYLLSNPGYTELVTQVGEQVFLFDATQGEERSIKDAALIARLFPGYKRLTVVVSDLAWPHVGGVRYWVANGATIIAHRAAREFLQSVVDRRWTLAPDLLEQRRKTAKLRLIGVDTEYKLAGDAISLHPIDGIGSEVALIAYLAPERLLWASDYIQTVDEPSLYASEVWHATQRDGLHPEHAVAEHVPLTPWAKIEHLISKDEAGAQSTSHGSH